MRIVIDIADTLIQEWGSIIIHPVSLDIQNATILLPGFKYSVPEDPTKCTFLVKAFRDNSPLFLLVNNSPPTNSNKVDPFTESKLDDTDSPTQNT